MKTREQWLTDRQTGLGASDAAAALGASPWKTPYQLWAEKCGLIEPDDISDNEAVEWGSRLEASIAEAFAERTGRIVDMWPQFEMVRNDDRPWQTCTPDATQEKDSRPDGGPAADVGLLQIKTTSQYNAADWENGGVPLQYQVQCQHELAVTGYEWTSLAVLIGGQKLVYMDIERDEKFIAAMNAAEAEFWHRVEERDPPPVDGSLATRNALAKLHPDDNGETVLLPPGADQWAEDLAQAKHEIKDIEKTKQLLENQIKAAVGDATYGELPGGGRFSWKTSERKGYTVEPNTIRTLRRLKK